MALCLANSLVVYGKFNPYDQLLRYKWWYRHGYMSSTGECFDIGAATKQSLEEFANRQEQFAIQRDILPEQMDNIGDQACLSEFDIYCSMNDVAGNGALMRLAPVPLFFYRFPSHAVEYSGQSGQLTHGDRKAYDACRYYGALIIAALLDYKKEEILDSEFYAKHSHWFGSTPLCSEILDICQGSYKKENGYDGGIRGKGYIVSALEAALWAFWSDEESFEKGVLAAVNLGDDTDTTAAIYGQLAGAYYGFKKLPRQWLKHVYAKDFILNLSQWIGYEGHYWQPTESVAELLALARPQLPSNSTRTNESESNKNSAQDENDTVSFDSVVPKGITKTEKQQHKKKLRAVGSDGGCSALSWRQTDSKHEPLIPPHARPSSNKQTQVTAMTSRSPTNNSDRNQSSVITDKSNTSSTISESHRNASESSQQYETVVATHEKPPVNDQRSVSYTHERSSQLLPSRHRKLSCHLKKSLKSNKEPSLKKTPSFSSTAPGESSSKNPPKLQKSGSTSHYLDAIDILNTFHSPSSNGASPTTYAVRLHTAKPLDSVANDTTMTNERSRSDKKSSKMFRSSSATKSNEQQNASSDQMHDTNNQIFKGGH